LRHKNQTINLVCTLIFGELAPFGCGCNYCMMSRMRTIAEELNLSVATVSRALRNDPSVKPATRALIRRKAKEVGYELNGYLGELMSSIRRGTTQTFKGNLGLLWGAAIPGKKSDPRLLQIQQGAQDGAERLGYSLNEFSLADYESKNLARILTNRGVEGLLITVPAFTARKAYLRFEFEKFTTVFLGWGLMRPAMHSVRFDYFHGMRLALHHTRHAFGDKIASVWDELTDRRSHSIARGAFITHHPAGVAKAEKLFLAASGLDQKKTLALLERHKIEALLVEGGVKLPAWLAEFFPPVNRIYFKDPGAEPSFGWIDTQNYLMGLWGSELIASKLRQHEKGIPAARQITLVPPEWKSGRDVRENSRF